MLIREAMIGPTTKEKAVVAAYTAGDAIWTLVVFVAWVASIVVAIWLLIRLFRNKNFLSENRALRIVVKVLLVVFFLFVPPLGVLVLFVIWYSTRSPKAPAAGSAAKPDTLRAPPTAPSADGATYRRPLPFPPPAPPEDPGG